MNIIAITFLAFMALFLVIGWLSSLRTSSTASDYLLAGRSVGPWFTALAAVATNNSGFMFIGLIGATYTAGISGMWIMVGWVLGDYLMWFWIVRLLREHSERHDAWTIPSILAARLTRHARAVRVVAALTAVTFLGTYAVAQLTAGSKALDAILGWDRSTGAILGAAIVAVYCMAGGVRASIWVNVAQSIVMIASMAVLLAAGLDAVGGAGELWSKLRAIDPALVDPAPPGLRFGFALFVIGWFAAGVGVVGQPHIMLAVLTIRNAKEINTARHIYFVWYVLFSAAAVGVALCGRILIPPAAGFDPELALPLLAKNQLPDALVGLVLAGLFSAAMSTADSQLLCCSSALTQDLMPSLRESYRGSKIATLGCTLLALCVALTSTESVFALVAMSWSALASALGPLLVVKTLDRPLDGSTAVAMMIAGLGMVVVWRYGLGLSGDLFEGLPGMLASTSVYLVRRVFSGGVRVRSDERL